MSVIRWGLLYFAVTNSMLVFSIPRLTILSDFEPTFEERLLNKDTHFSPSRYMRLLTRVYFLAPALGRLRVLIIGIFTGKTIAALY